MWTPKLLQALSANSGTDKTRISTGLSGLMLGKTSEGARRSAVNRSPAFERFVFSGSPIRKFRVDHDIRFKIEGESGLVLKPDVNEEVFWGNAPIRRVQ